MIEVEVNGKNLEGFTSVKLDENVENLCSVLQLNCVPDLNEKFPVSRGADIKAKVEGFVVFEGKVELVRVKAPQDSYSIFVRGRSLLKSLLKNDLPPKFSLHGPISLKRAIEKYLMEAGLGFDVVLEVDDMKDFSEREVLNKKVGSTVWELFVALAEKRQSLVRGNRQNKIAITRANKNKYKKVLQRLIVDTNNTNNILESEGESSDEGRKRVYHVVSQDNVSVKRKEAPPKGNELYVPDTGEEDSSGASNPNQALIDDLQNTLSQLPPDSEEARAIEQTISDLGGGTEASATDTEKPAGRMKTYGAIADLYVPDGESWEKAEDPSDNDECRGLAAKRCNNNRISSVSYECTVIDFIADEEPWEPGYLVPVVDEYCDVNALMCIQQVLWEDSISEDGEVAEICRLIMTLPDAYGEDSELSTKEAQVTVIGENFQQSELL
jgi:prophage tail gpP-like protein